MGEGAADGGAGERGPGHDADRSPDGVKRAAERAARERAGYRLGPLVFVPALRKGADDPWAHRKGEPRVLALLWAMYLMAGSLLTVFAGQGIDSSSARQLEFASLGFVSVAAFGGAVLFPMVRLSQAAPAAAWRALLVDVVVVSAPMAVVIPALPFLTRWPFAVSIAITVQVCGWVVLVGGFVALVLARGGGPSGDVGGGARAWAMAVVVLLVCGGPMLDIGWRVVDPLGFGAGALLASPLTGPWVVSSSEAENLLPRVSGREWSYALAPAVAGAALFVAAFVVGLGARARGAAARPDGAGDTPSS